jgi:SAM-dependent methyltransferase
MKNKDDWRPTKFVYRRNKLVASRDQKEVGVSSRLAVDLIGSQYQFYLEKFAKGRLIDLGCSKVPLYEAYKDYITDCICVDWANGVKGNPYLDFECDLNEPLPFQSGEFDTILLSDVLEHIAKPAELWLEMARILQPGGTLIMNTPFLYKIHAMPYDYFRYTEYALSRFATTSGFKIILLKPVGGSPEVISDLMAKTIAFVPLVGKPLASFIQTLCQLFVKTSFGKKLSDKSSKTFPFAYFLVAEKI